MWRMLFVIIILISNWFDLYPESMSLNNIFCSGNDYVKIDAGNCIYKKIPGCNASYFKYDKGNRLVAERDGAMSTNRWKVHFYDKYSREVITGIMSATEDEIDILTDTIVKGNRSRVDAFINNGDDTYSVIEYKLSDKTPLSKGQKAVQNHVTGGNQMFEVRSTVDPMGLKPGAEIQVKDYKVEYKYKY